jgi:hypothetical protein|tara:strand:- start:163 stop:363 length:201 start_codon:yes stop_codon:yes gene_type:complete
MGYHKRNRITYHGVKGERIEVTRPVKKRVPLRKFSSFIDISRIQDLTLAIFFLIIGLGCILYIITS